MRGLRKSYGPVVALDGIDLDVEAGEICGLLGPNGAGKTTLVSIVAGLRNADAGSVTVNGVDALARSDEARRHIGFAPQDLGVYFTLSVRDNLRFFGELADLRGRDLARRIDEVAEAFALTDLIGRRAHTLSGGEKRRLHGAMAVLHRPPLLLLDEPTTGVDVATRAHVLAAVRRLAAEDGCAITYSTHYLNEVDALGASVAIIDHGRIIARGSVASLVARHGRSAVELRFEGTPPEVDFDPAAGAAIDADAARGAVEVTGDTVRIFSESPAEDAAAVLARLGPDAERLLSVEFLSSDLETVFLALTGRRFAADEGTDDGSARGERIGESKGESEGDMEGESKVEVPDVVAP